MAHSTGADEGDGYVMGIIPSVLLLLRGLGSALVGTPLALLGMLLSGQASVPKVLALLAGVLPNLASYLSDSFSGLSATLSKPVDLEY